MISDQCGLIGAVSGFGSRAGEGMGARISESISAKERQQCQEDENDARQGDMLMAAFCVRGKSKECHWVHYPVSSSNTSINAAVISMRLSDSQSNESL